MLGFRKQRKMICHEVIFKSFQARKNEGNKETKLSSPRNKQQSLKKANKRHVQFVLLSETEHFAITRKYQRLSKWCTGIGFEKNVLQKASTTRQDSFLRKFWFHIIDFVSFTAEHQILLKHKKQTNEIMKISERVEKCLYDCFVNKKWYLKCFTQRSKIGD